MNIKSADIRLLNQDRHALFFSTIASLLLLALELIFSHITNSLLLFSIGLVQFSLSAFSLITLILKNPYPLKIRLLTALINGFVLILLTGYIFIEFFTRFAAPAPIISGDALLMAVLCLALNLLIFRTLTRTHLANIKFGTFRLPVWSIVFSSLMALAGTAIIYYTNYYFLDALLSLVLGIIILIRAGFMTIDAYWHIYELAYNKRWSNACEWRDTGA